MPIEFDDPDWAERVQEVIEKQQNLKALIAVIQANGLQNTLNWCALAKTYHDLEAQFPVRKRRWWERILRIFDWRVRWIVYRKGQE